MVNPWVSFCISTYKRPVFLKSQLNLLLQQTDPNFEIVISDNDPEASGKAVVEQLNDQRLKYYRNDDNLGMIRSFNKSIERASTEYIVMVTDDDPVDTNMLHEFKTVINNYPGYSIYCGCVRTGKSENEIECFSATDFSFQLLHPKLTLNFLWSSCVLKKQTVLNIGGMPDYGSPHLADHAMLALCSKEQGGLFINKMFSHLNKHDSNFSKSNFNLYYIAGTRFIALMTKAFPEEFYIKNGENAIAKHLKKWFITNIFILKKYFTITNPNPEKAKEVDQLAHNLLKLSLIKKFKTLYTFKLIVFNIKKCLKKVGILKWSN
ncbi:hypothetical protein A8C56_07030 [Niabella ginsenosidivorans]|uniref:Glycosyltransferase 2-like domain-containing protein n=1 Tax=Niabella ginsenosidivorans TaxID=1176587 RepID=A0A1A9HZF8_9BACT|nr:glycosyltransferase family 2 protein [Niabella ginsenosidivorans]ANH80766.1 hypothetical protein A8C56_07030 [Niabella ginsenosidivorans]